MPLNLNHENEAQAVEEAVEETLEDQAEQNSQVSPYGTPAEPAEEQELNFGNWKFRLHLNIACAILDCREKDSRRKQTKKRKEPQIAGIIWSGDYSDNKRAPVYEPKTPWYLTIEHYGVPSLRNGKTEGQPFFVVYTAYHDEDRDTCYPVLRVYHDAQGKVIAIVDLVNDNENSVDEYFTEKDAIEVIRKFSSRTLAAAAHIKNWK